MLLKRSVIEEVGGYDPYALAEDAELTIRITAKDYLLPVVPEAETWEQEPENLKVFIKQRTRWLIGNLYLLEKLFYDPTFWRGKVLYHTGQHLLTYFFFVIMLLFSNVWVVLNLVGVDLPVLTQPLLMIWFLSYMVFSFQVVGSMIFNQNTSAINLLVGMFMYFTYSQLFLILLFRAIYSYSVSRLRGKTIAWDKTKRYKEGQV
jgi:cellulose synthase/poly-beta-1,6-N-acetylglucosamine synthase-like glycosyltransferase